MGLELLLETEHLLVKQQTEIMESNPAQHNVPEIILH